MSASKVILTFDKAMSSPTGKESEFSVSKGGGSGGDYQEWENYPDSPDLTSSYPYQFIIYNTYYHRYDLYVSMGKLYESESSPGLIYASGNVNIYKYINDSWEFWFSENGSAPGLIENVVENNAPIYTDSTCTTVLVPKTTVGETSLTIDTITQPTTTTYQFNIAETLTLTDVITCEYTQGTVTSADGGTLPSFSNSVVNYCIPNYHLATDSEFSGTTDGNFRYIGTDKFMIIPEVIKEVTITSTELLRTGQDGDYLANIGVALLNTNIVNMDSLFYYALANTIEVTYLNTSSVTNMAGMFIECSRQTSLDLSTFDTSNVLDMNWMFGDNNNLASLDVSNFDTSKVTNMEYMFTSCESLTTLDLSSFDTSNVTSSDYMFAYCDDITTAYARTQADADFFNATVGIPSTLTFIVKP